MNLRPVGSNCFHTILNTCAHQRLVRDSDDGAQATAWRTYSHIMRGHVLVASIRGLKVLHDNHDEQIQHHELGHDNEGNEVHGRRLGPTERRV